MRTIEELEQYITWCGGCTKENDLERLWLEWFRAVACDIEPDRLKEICEAEKDGRCVVLPCKVGEQLFVPTTKEYSVRNDYDNACDVCELNEPMEYELYGLTYKCCKKSYNDECPTVIKPITVEVFEIRDKEAIPCYRVDYEDNSEITNWSITKEAAEKALKGGASV